MKVPPRTLEDSKPGRHAQVDIVSTATTEEGHTTYEVELLLGGALQRVVTLARRGRRYHASPVVMPHPLSCLTRLARSVLYRESPYG